MGQSTVGSQAGVRWFQSSSIKPLTSAGQTVARACSLSRKRLTRLMHYADTLPLTPQVGLIYGEQHYFSLLKMSLMSSTETWRRAHFMQHVLLDRLSKPRSLLEVGIGDARLTRWLTKHFSRAVLVEPNAQAVCQVTQQSFPHCQIDVVPGHIEDIELKQQRFDLINLSHMLYYIPEQQWVPLIKKLYTHLKPGGKMLITLSGDQDMKGTILNEFSTCSYDFEHFVTRLTEQVCDCAALSVSEDKLQAASLRALTEIMGFFLQQRNVVLSRDELSAFLRYTVPCQDGVYSVDTLQYFITLTKKQPH